MADVLVALLTLLELIVEFLWVFFGGDRRR